MISEILLLNGHGEVFMCKRYRDDITVKTREILSKKFKDTIPGHSPPHFIQDGVHYFFIHRGGVILSAVCSKESTPVHITDYLNRLHQILKDFCGVVTEQSIKANVFLVREILDEFLSGGYAQLTTSDKLRPYVQSDACTVQQSFTKDDLAARLFGIESRVASKSASTRPIISKTSTDQNEIFLDVIERLTALVDVKGVARRIAVNGEVTLKSFVTGTPHVQIALNEDLRCPSLGHCDPGGYSSGVYLDHCTFHPSLDLSQFNQSHLVSIHPPHTEVKIMSYVITSDTRLTLPFVVETSRRNLSRTDYELTVTVRSQFPAGLRAVNVSVSVPTSPHTTHVAHRSEVREHSDEFVKSASEVRWFMREFSGATTHRATFRLMSDSGHKPSPNRPIAIEFELSGYACSGLHIRNMRVMGGVANPQAPPRRWIRYITVSDSYVQNTINNGTATPDCSGEKPPVDL